MASVAQVAKSKAEKETGEKKPLFCTQGRGYQKSEHLVMALRAPQPWLLALTCLRGSTARSVVQEPQFRSALGHLS